MTPHRSNKSEDESSPAEKTETLQERSARLEAEVAAGKAAPSGHEEDTPAAEDYESAADQYEETEGPNYTIDPAALNSHEDTQSLAAELQQAREQTMRALADAENTRRRATKEREDSSKFAVSGFARDLLSVADNLRRALESIPADLTESDPRLQNIIEGIEATERELLKAFEKRSIQKVESLDEIFNPNLHEVMFEIPNSGKPAGTIIQVVEPGYMIHDRLLRPARVGVAKDDGKKAEDSGPCGPGGQIDTEA